MGGCAWLAGGALAGVWPPGGRRGVCYGLCNDFVFVSRGMTRGDMVVLASGHFAGRGARLGPWASRVGAASMDGAHRKADSGKRGLGPQGRIDLTASKGRHPCAGHDLPSVESRCRGKKGTTPQDQVQPRKGGEIPRAFLPGYGAQASGVAPKRPKAESDRTTA